MSWSKGAALLGCLSLPLAMPSMASSGGWLTEIGTGIESGSGSSFGLRQLGLSGPLVNGRDGNEQWQTAWQLEYTRFNWQGSEAASGDYLWLSLPLAYQQQRSARQQLRIHIEPGLMSDLSGLNVDHFRVNLHAVSRHTLRHIREYWQWGLIVDRRFGDAKIRPSLAYAWPVSRHTQASLGFPYSLLQTDWSPTMQTFVRVQPAGGIWQETVKVSAANGGVDGDIDGEGGDDVNAGDEGGAADEGAVAGAGLAGDVSSRLRYNHWQLSLGGRFLWRDGWWVSAEVGQLRDRRIHATSSNGDRISATPSNNGYWLLGVELTY